MGRKKQSPGSFSTNGQANYDKQPKGNNFDSQLQFPWWYIQRTEKITQTTQDKDSKVNNRRDSLQLDIADQKMQKITERRDKKAEPGTQKELPFMESIPPLPPAIEPPAALIPDDEGKPIRELPESYIGRGDVKGFKFTQIKMSEHAYVYQVQNYGRPYYEIFERRVNTQFRNVTYPSSKAFGRWAWTTCDLQKAMEIFDALNYRRDEPCA